MFIKLEVILISNSLIDCLPAPLYPHLLHTPHSIWFSTFLHCSRLTNPYVFLYCFISYIFIICIFHILQYLLIFLCMFKFTIQLVICIFLFKCQVRAFLSVVFFPDFYIFRKQKTFRCSNVFRRFKDVTLAAD